MQEVDDNTKAMLSPRCYLSISIGEVLRRSEQLSGCILRVGVIVHLTFRRTSIVSSVKYDDRLSQFSMHFHELL